MGLLFTLEKPSTLWTTRYLFKKLDETGIRDVLIKWSETSFKDVSIQICKNYL